MTLFEFYKIKCQWAILLTGLVCTVHVPGGVCMSFFYIYSRHLLICLQNYPSTVRQEKKKMHTVSSEKCISWRVHLSVSALWPSADSLGFCLLDHGSSI